MSVIGWYCKAYEANRFQAFSGWAEVQKKCEESTPPIGEDGVLFLHEDFAVTAGPVREENIIFDNVTDTWREFCAQTLQFRVPEYMQGTNVVTGSK